MGIDSLGKVAGELRRALDVSYERARVISENLASGYAPGYKARKIDFQKAMINAEHSSGLDLSKSNARHISPTGSTGRVKVEISNRPLRADGNNVDQEIEIVNMSENSIIYNTASELLSRRIKQLKFAIEEGGK